MVPDMADEAIRLIEELSNSLQHEMAQLNKKLDHELGDVKNMLAQVLLAQKRHSALFAADAMAVRGMERSVMQHDEAIAALTRRLTDLENRTAQ
jgi:polyhydroxyalkanoate synthesis regulator phasin